jgi:hypothetical protein
MTTTLSSRRWLSRRCAAIRGFGSLAFALSVLLFSRGAQASAIFDIIIKMQLGLPPEGPLLCTRCHATDEGGEKTVDKPFGLRALQLGLQKQDVPKLREILKQMEAANDDSDCDGIGDIAELRQGSNPNAGEAGVGCPEALELARYGCYCSVSAYSGKNASRFGGAALASTALVAALLVARRSRSATRSRQRVGPMGSVRCCPAGTNVRSKGSRRLESCSGSR